MQRLAGKVAVITGGANGIGFAAGKLFAEEGAQVVLVDLSAEALQKAVAAIRAQQEVFLAAELWQPEQAEGYVRAAVERCGGLDVLICNAGIEGIYELIPDYPLDIFD